MKQLTKSLVVLSAMVLTLKVQAQTTIKIDGSSSVYPISEAMAEEFQTANKGKTQVTVGVSGTGGGFKKFCRGEIDISNASRPIKKEELETCKKANIKFVELPVAFDATVIIVHPSNKLTEIKVEELKKMWEPEAQGKVMSWSDINPKWPKLPLKLFGSGADSGTFDYFTEAIVGKANSSRGDYTAIDDKNVIVKGVAGDKGALGYVPLAYYLENKNKLKALAVVNKTGKAVMPSKETVENASYNPLSRPLFIYVSEAGMKKPEVKEFVKMYIDKATSIVSQVKYVPLPGKNYSMALEHFNKPKLGSVFGGVPSIGMTIDELMKKEVVE